MAETTKAYIKVSRRISLLLLFFHQDVAEEATIRCQPDLPVGRQGFILARPTGGRILAETTEAWTIKFEVLLDYIFHY